MRESARRLADRLTHTTIPAVLTPMTPDRRVHVPALEAYAAAVTAEPIGAVAVWAHTGRGPYLSAAERLRILATFRNGTDLPLIAGIAAPRDDAGDPVRAALTVAEQAAAGGADALLVFPPPAFADRPDRDAALIDLHARLAERVGLPMLLFVLHAAAGGYAYPPALLRELLALPDVAGVKIATLDSAVTCQDITALVRAEFPDRVAITGEDRMFGPSLMWGAQAALVGIAAACVRLSADLLTTWNSPGQDGFLAASERIDRLAAATFTEPIEGYVQRMAWAAAAEGLVPAEAAHDPFGPRLPSGERDRVRAAVASLQEAVG